MSKNFKERYPDFASIEHQIRQAHAERSVAIATAFADVIIGAVRGIGRLFAGKPVAPASRTLVKATVQRAPARV